MDKFLTQISDPAWLLGVVVVSFMINVLSSYFRTGTDKILSRMSNRWRNKTKKKRDEREKLIILLAKSEIEMKKREINGMAMRYLSLTSFCFAIIFLIISKNIDPTVDFFKGVVMQGAMFISMISATISCISAIMNFVLLSEVLDFKKQTTSNTKSA